MNSDRNEGAPWVAPASPTPTTSANKVGTYTPKTRPATPVGDAKDNAGYGRNPVIPSSGGNSAPQYNSNPAPFIGPVLPESRINTNGGVGSQPYGPSLINGNGGVGNQPYGPEQPSVKTSPSGREQLAGWGGGSGGGSTSATPTAPLTPEQRAANDSRFYESLQAAQTAAANGDPQPLRNFDNFFGTTRPEAQYGADYYNMRLVKGDGPALADDQLQGNGNALYVVNKEGERFHVTANAAQEMINNGSWKAPEVMNQAQLDNMALRYSVDSAASMGTINGPKYNGFMLIKGDGPALADDQLQGNGNALYAVDNKGNMFHVTGAAYSEMIAQNGGVAPTHVVMNQAVVDGMVVDGAMTSASTGSLYNPAAATVPPPLPPAPEPPVASTPEPYVPNQQESSAAVEQQLRNLGISDQQVAMFVDMYQTDKTAALSFIDGLNLSPADRTMAIGYIESRVQEEIGSASPEEERNISTMPVDPDTQEGQKEANSESGQAGESTPQSETQTEQGAASTPQEEVQAEQALAAATAKRQSSREERLKKIMEMRKPYTSGGGSSTGADAMIAPAISPASQVPPPPLP